MASFPWKFLLCFCGEGCMNHACSPLNRRTVLSSLAGPKTYYLYYYFVFEFSLTQSSLLENIRYAS